MTTPLELLFRPFFRGPAMTKASSDATQFAGRTTLNSGDVTVTVSTTAVGSDTLVLFSCLSPTAAASGFGHAIDVRSISPGNWFTLGHRDGIGRGPTTTVLWELRKTS